MKQHDLNGNEINKEIIETQKTVYHGKFFDLTITEGGESQLEKLAEAGKDNRQWIACHMKVKETLTIDQEGDCYKDDLDLFRAILK